MTKSSTRTASQTYNVIKNFSNVKKPANILESTPVKRQSSPIASNNKRYTIDNLTLPKFEN